MLFSKDYNVEGRKGLHGRRREGKAKTLEKKKSHLLTRRLSHANKPYRAHHMTVTIQNAIVTAT